MWSYIYHALMFRYWRWRTHCAIRQLKRAGRRHGLTSLDCFTDDQIVEGILRSRQTRQ